METTYNVVMQPDGRYAVVQVAWERKTFQVLAKDLSLTDARAEKQRRLNRLRELDQMDAHGGINGDWR